MKNRRYLLLFVLVFAVMAMIIVINRPSTSELLTETEETEMLSNEDTDENLEEKTPFFSWNVYWDQESSVEELEILGDKLTSLSHFAAYFDSQNKLFIPERLLSFYEDTKDLNDKHPYDHYLTFVNDKVNEDGSSSLKDRPLLHDLLSTEATRKEHIQDIIRLTQQGQFDGIEIDYEAIKDDLDLWHDFVSFIQELYQVTKAEEIHLRVLFEPSAPLEELDFPKGPEYVMMAYNLHGFGTEAGPKADKEFIKEMVEKLDNLPGHITLAIATGGFDWQGDSVVALTEVQAESLRHTYGVEAQRDQESQYLVFNYEDEDNNYHEVWYADSVTLRYLIEEASESGMNSFALWRLGGNIHEIDEY